ncbi:MAG: DNA/RNA non-specific endonuclease [Rhizobacter sp.]|nr:DNA/RNA non-specific endonuclease [Chlorobiales bacterium]
MSKHRPDASALRQQAWDYALTTDATSAKATAGKSGHIRQPITAQPPVDAARDASVRLSARPSHLDSPYPALPSEPRLPMPAPAAACDATTAATVHVAAPVSPLQHTLNLHSLNFQALDFHALDFSLRLKTPSPFASNATRRLRRGMPMHILPRLATRLSIQVSNFVSNFFTFNFNNVHSKTGESPMSMKTFLRLTGCLVIAATFAACSDNTSSPVGDNTAASSAATEFKNGKEKTVFSGTQKQAASNTVAAVTMSETEYNTTTSTANNIPSFPATVTGVIYNSSDVDHYGFSVSAGQAISLGMTVPSGKDYDVYLLNSSGSQVAYSENGTSASEAINYTASSAGTYYIKVIGYNGASSTTAQYSISLNVTGGSTPPPPPPPPSGNSETESNNSTSSANAVGGVPATRTGYISSSSDVDYFSVSASSGQSISLGLTVPSGKDYDLALINPSGSQVAVAENGAGASESINFTATSTGTYYIKVFGYNGAFSTTVNYTLSVNVTGGTTPPPPSSSVHLTMGNPSNAVTNTANSTNYLMIKTQYALSYNDTDRKPNWTSWQVSNFWLGSTPRQDDFRADNTLPAGWYQVQGNGYSGSGYDRGHMCPSADRTSSTTNNSATFLMTNMIPQAPDNNQGPWANLENYTRDLVRNSGKECFVIMGSYGSNGTIASGVKIPTRTWKVIVVLDQPGSGVAGVSTSTRVIAVDMPNVQGIRSNDWKSYRVSVDAIEQSTGYDILNAVSASIQSTIESRVDTQ